MADPPPPQPRVMLGATLLILLQFVSRAITFIANQLLLRYLTAQLLGISTHLEVYYLSVLFFARESLRVAIQRQGSFAPTNEADPAKKTDEKSDNSNKGDVKAGEKDLNNNNTPNPQTEDPNASQAAVNLATLAPILGALLALVLGTIYLRSLAPATLAATPYLAPAVPLYALAALLELLSEPAFVLLQLRLNLTARARAEALATTAKCAVTLAAAVLGRGNTGVLPFALGQLAFGSVLLGVYLGTARTLGLGLLPQRLSATKSAEDGSYVLGCFYAPTLNLALALSAQNAVKYFLTQGDSLLMGVLASAETQGVYALAANYGSLAARLVFQPVEEAGRGYFSRLLASASSNAVTDDKKKKQQQGDEKKTKNEDSDALVTARSALNRLLHAYTLISLPLLALAPPAAPLLLSLVAGAHWTHAGGGAALAAYVYYIPLLALNGLLEAFVASVATRRQLGAQSAWMAGFFGVFGAVAVVLVGWWGWGAAGVVVANGVNMGLRIAWAAWFIGGWFKARGVVWSVGEVLPGPGAVAAAAVAGQVMRSVMGDVVPVGAKAVVLELAKVAGVGVGLLPVLAFTERRFLIDCYRAVKG